MEAPRNLYRAVSAIGGNIEWPPPTDRQADAFVRESITQGVFSLAFADRSLPPIIRGALRRAAAMEYAARARTRLQLEALHQLSGLMRGEEFILLKGSDYIFRLYPEPSLRQMNDIDFLVPRGRMNEVHARLTAGGAVQRFFLRSGADRLPSHHETVYRLGSVTVEPHHSFIQRVRTRIDYDAVWERRRPASPAGDGASLLCSDDAILYHSLGLAIKEFNVPLIRYFDLYLLLLQSPPDCDVLINRAVEWRITRAFYASLRQLVRAIPEASSLAEPLMNQLLAPAQRAALDGKLPSPIRPRVPFGRMKQLKLKWLLLEGYRERLGFLSYHLWSIIVGWTLLRRKASVIVIEGSDSEKPPAHSG